MPRRTLPRLDRRSYIKATGAGIAVSTLAGCLGDDDDDTANGDDDSDANGDEDTGDLEDDPIVISSLQPMSGIFAQYGPRHSRGAEWAADLLNENGGVLDRRVEINEVDTASDPEEASTAFINHIDDGAVAGIGPGDGSTSVAAGEIANDDEVPLLIHAAGASEITPPDNRHVFRTNLSATPQAARAQLQIIEEFDLTEGAVIYAHDNWGDEFQAGIEAYWPDDITLHEDDAPLGEDDFGPILRNFPEDDIEFFLGSGHPPGVAQMYPQLMELGFDLEVFTAAITPIEADYEELEDDMAEFNFCSFNNVDMYSDSYAEIAQDYLDATGDIFDTAQAGGYLAVMLIAEAIEEAGEANPTEISAALREGEYDLGIYANPIEYTEYGEIDNVVQIYNSIEPGESPDHWPDVGFSPREIFRTDPLPAYDHELDLH